MEVIVMTICLCAMIVVQVPRAWRRRAFGYVNLADFAAVSFIVTHFMGAGAAAGSLYIGVLAMLTLAIVLRYGRAQFGSEKLELNGDSSISAVTAGLMTQAARWIRAFTFSLINGGVINKPAPLDWRWVEDLKPPESFWEGNSRFWSTI